MTLDPNRQHGQAHMVIKAFKGHDIKCGEISLQREGVQSSRAVRLLPGHEETRIPCNNSGLAPYSRFLRYG